MSKKYRITEAQLTKIYENLNKINEEAMVDKREGTSINPSSNGAKEWEKISKPGTQVKDGLKSGGAAKNIESSTAKKGEWEKISVPQSPEAKKHITSMKAGDIKSTKTSEGASKPKEGEWDKADKKHAPEAKADVKGSLKNNSKANTKATETKDPVVKESLSPSQMRHKKTDEIAEAAKRLDAQASSKAVEVKVKK